MAQRSPLPTNIHGCRQILGGTHARKRRADSRCRNSLAQFFLSAGGSIRVSAVVISAFDSCPGSSFGKIASHCRFPEFKSWRLSPGNAYSQFRAYYFSRGNGAIVFNPVMLIGSYRSVPCAAPIWPLAHVVNDYPQNEKTRWEHLERIRQHLRFQQCDNFSF